MTNDQLETVSRIYDLWQRGDPSALNLFAADCELRPDPGSDWPGVEPLYHGPAGVAQFMATIFDSFDDYRPEVEEMIDAGDGVVVTLAVESARGKQSGIVTTRRTAHVWTIQDRSVVRLEVIWDRDAALARAGVARRTA